MLLAKYKTQPENRTLSRPNYRLLASHNYQLIYAKPTPPPRL